MSRITDLSTSVYESFAMLAGMQLDLFSLLADDPQTVGELASHLNVRSDKLAILCYALVATELLTVSDDRFSNTDESDRFLVRDKPEFLGDRHHIWSRIWPATMQAAESIRTGKPQAHLDFSSISDDEQIEFFSGLHPASISGGREFAAACDLSQHRSMVDVGGGSGGFTLGLIEKWSHLQATVVDLPHITTVTRRFIEEAGATDKITIVGADLVTEPCPDSLTDTFDVAILRNFIQVLSPDDAKSALGHVADALHPGGRIYVTGHILDDTRAAPRESVTFNLVFLNIYENGQAYTQHEYETWLEEAGYTDIEFLTEDLVTALKT